MNVATADCPFKKATYKMVKFMITVNVSGVYNASADCLNYQIPSLREDSSLSHELLPMTTLPDLLKSQPMDWWVMFITHCSKPLKKHNKKKT